MPVEQLRNSMGDESMVSLITPKGSECVKSTENIILTKDNFSKSTNSSVVVSDDENFSKVLTDFFSF